MPFGVRKSSAFPELYQKGHSRFHRESGGVAARTLGSSPEQRSCSAHRTAKPKPKSALMEHPGFGQKLRLSQFCERLTNRMASSKTRGL